MTNTPKLAVKVIHIGLNFRYKRRDFHVVI